MSSCRHQCLQIKFKLNGIFSGYIGKLTTKLRIKTALRTDERVRFMDEVISGVRVIKMYAWERLFAKVIFASRQLELKVILSNAYIRAAYLGFLMFTSRAVLFCTMLAMISLYGQESLTVAKLFKATAFVNVITYAMSQHFVRGVGEISETIAAFRRLQNFLDYEEKGNHIESSEGEKKLESPQMVVSVKGLTANWVKFTKEIEKGERTEDEQPMLANGIKLKEYNHWRPPTLHDINLEIPKGKLIGIVGPVGAGKSSLLQALLRELPLESGSISVNGTISYACQESWIFAGSVRQNILFGQEMDRARYNAVLKSCDLNKDLQSFDNGDLTMIGERGASLSGGQKARIK